MNSPVATTEASTFVKPALDIAATKSSASAIVDPSKFDTVTVLLERAACPLIDSAITNDPCNATGSVVLEVTTVSPPSYLNVWKSPTGSVVSVSFTAVCSVTLNCE